MTKPSGLSKEEAHRACLRSGVPLRRILAALLVGAAESEAGHHLIWTEANAIQNELMGIAHRFDGTRRLPEAISGSSS
ncbi:MAG: hypothetical protein M0R80_24860 [Proteobacteria bacterium]|jgi:hypothetical protein|nr:hypothetical protein [Pseudomonadota bacterium]